MKCGCCWKENGDRNRKILNSQVRKLKPLVKQSNWFQVQIWKTKGFSLRTCEFSILRFLSSFPFQRQPHFNFLNWFGHVLQDNFVKIEMFCLKNVLSVLSSRTWCHENEVIPEPHFFRWFTSAYLIIQISTKYKPTSFTRHHYPNQHNTACNITSILLFRLCGGYSISPLLKFAVSHWICVHFL